MAAATRGHPEFNKRLGEFFTNGTSPCPDCGMDMPAGDHDLRMAHYAVCGGKRVDGDALTTVEANELAAREQVIERGFKVWQEVGEALLHIRDKRLYRATHKTFEDYCQSRWQMTRRNVNYMLEASVVYEDLGKIFPKNELPQAMSQIRELIEATPDAIPLVWQVVTDTAPNGKVTAAHVKSVVNVLREVNQTGAIDDGTGEQIPVAAATPEHLKAAITEETYERMQRQEAHIAEHQARKAGGVPPALQSSESNEWYTPKVYMDAVHAVLGAIDVDPASNAEANKLVQAAAFYDVLTDGLVRDWRGKVFLNPPYGRDGISNQERWSLRLIEQYQAGITTEAILLVNAVTDRTWFQALWDFPICFTHHRIPFYKPGGSPGAQPVCGSAFVYLGANHIQFARVFRQFGAVVLTTIRGDDHE
jgi:hypothetical protein